MKNNRIIKGIVLITAGLLTATLFITSCGRNETQNNTVIPQSTADTTTNADTATQKPVESGTKLLITEDEAKRIALSHAGVSENQAERLRIHLDYEDGLQVQKVEFDANGYEYEYEIDAKTGQIVKFEKEPR